MRCVLEFAVAQIEPLQDDNVQIGVSISQYPLITINPAKKIGKLCEFEMSSDVLTITFMLMTQDSAILASTENMKLSDLLRSLPNGINKPLVKRRFTFSNQQGWCDVYIRFTKVSSARSTPWTRVVQPATIATPRPHKNIVYGKLCELKSNW